MNEIVKGADEVFCRECATVIKARAVICPACGCPQAAASSTHMAGPHAKSKNTAGLLALMLGGFGVHKYYLNQPKAGFLYMCLFCVFFISLALGLVDAIRLFGMTDAEFDRLYNKLS